MERAIVAVLRDDAGVNDLIGSGTSAALYAAVAPQDASPPHVVYQLIADVAECNHNAAGGLRQATVQLNCYGTTYTAARQLAAAVESALLALDESVDVSGGSIDVMGLIPSDASNLHFAPIDGDEQGRHQIMLEFTGFYRFTAS